MDRAALDWAMKFGVEHGGWCPRGRLAEDGRIEPQYDLTETPSDDYSVRTQWNVRDSDATVIMSLGDSIVGGTELTRAMAIAYHKPVIHVTLDSGVDLASARLKAFLAGHAVKVLNVAGPRASQEHGMEPFVFDVLEAVFRDVERL